MLHEVSPREGAGRDTISRFQAQFRAAGYASLEILEGKNIDRVYCDYHDDFVVRHKNGSQYFYHFFQVKTKSKRNHQWSLLEIFGIKKKGQSADRNALDRIRDSFAGKLLIHTINFGESCLRVTLLTNVQFSDDVESMIEDLSKSPISNSKLQFLIKHLCTAFELSSPFFESEVEANICKLCLQPGITYLNADGGEFYEQARSAIYKFSEIDLEHSETLEILESLVSLVEKKSSTQVLSSVTEADLDDKAGIGIEELLEILSISKTAYQNLLNGGDSKALKRASIMQRKLSEAGASDAMIEYCTQQKINWDVWLREKRHLATEYDLNFLLEELDQIQKTWAKSGARMGALQTQIDELYSSKQNSKLGNSLTKDLLLGGVFSFLVRSETE
ncbi:uncharacterized protein DUF4297 [Nitrosomonas oligotropha]|uniref:Uncharacterized protein DUF4297 n=1 Tax=Nitrosomonas oligotropha TaxID=42354 RepID=A0A2T5H5J7_9PROT|nr:dsDNA nuclease domain-containing protein [Nitrosomonas oligotropha]PTQ66853.1 uncharacterized protein DUF4297 [Nitrosomonas oligotropha]